MILKSIICGADFPARLLPLGCCLVFSMAYSSPSKESTEGREGNFGAGEINSYSSGSKNSSNNLFRLFTCSQSKKSPPNYLNYRIQSNGWLSLQGSFSVNGKSYALDGAVRAVFEENANSSSMRWDLEAVPGSLQLRNKPQGKHFSAGSIVVKKIANSLVVDVVSPSNESLIGGGVRSCKASNIWHVKKALDFPKRSRLGSGKLVPKSYGMIPNDYMASEMSLAKSAKSDWSFSVEAVVKRESTPNGVIFDAPVSMNQPDAASSFFYKEEECDISGYSSASGITLVQSGMCDGFGFGVDVSGEYF